MTSTLERPPLRRPVRRDAPERSPLGPGAVAAAWAAGAGLVALGIPLLLVWATDSRAGTGAAAPPDGFPRRRLARSRVQPGGRPVRVGV